MRRTMLLLTGAVALLVAVVASSRLTVAQTTAPKWEYLRMAPAFLSTAQQQPERVGYKACGASAGADCRDFEGDELKALTALGQEGWELVAAFSSRPEYYPVGTIYLFKRAKP